VSPDRWPEVAVLGLGTMGHGIAQCFAVKGHRVRLFDADPETLASAPARIRRNLDVFLDLALIEPAEAEACLANLAPCDGLDSLAQGADLIIEAVSEDLELKRRLFAQLEALAGPEAILATNTSALSIGLISQNLQRPERVVGLHFWNPPHVLPCVEIIRSRFTSEQVFEAAAALIQAIGKEPVRVLKDVPGFLGNRMQHALQREAMNLVDKGIASPEDVDRVVKYGFGPRLAFIGPLERADQGGLDVTYQVQSFLLPHLDNSTRPSSSLEAKVREGRFGLKTGQGYYDWPPDRVERTLRERDRLLIRILSLVRETGLD